MADQYSDIWRHHFEDEGGPSDDTGAVLSAKIPELILTGLKGVDLDDSLTFDAILVDEGQDFDPRWWAALREICRTGGEMILAADMTQDVYGTGSRWTDETMAGAGFRGPWSELPVSYRLPPSILDIAAKFANTVLPKESLSPPKGSPNQTELDLSPCDLKWVQIKREDAPEVCVRELFDLIRKDDKNTRAIPDLTLLTDNIDDGVEIVNTLGAKGVNTVHTFAESRRGEQNRAYEDRRKKLGFWKGTPE